MTGERTTPYSADWPLRLRFAHAAADNLRAELDALRAALTAAETERDAIQRDASDQAAMNNAPSALVTSPSWQCPVCDSPGHVHQTECFIQSLADEATRLRGANIRLVRTNGRLRERSEHLEGALEEIKWAQVDALKRAEMFEEALRKIEECGDYCYRPDEFAAMAREALDALDQVRRERDEAHAEIERLEFWLGIRPSIDTNNVNLWQGWSALVVREMAADARAALRATETGDA